jgi:hypothetical protein
VTYIVKARIIVGCPRRLRCRSRDRPRSWAGARKCHQGSRDRRYEACVHDLRKPVRLGAVR